MFPLQRTDSTCRVHFADSELKVAKASKQYVFDTEGNEYLDCVSNSAHVGHCHPHVVAAGQAQMAKIWVSQGFTHDTYSKYVKGLLESLPDKLSVIYFLNSGSEANDLALMLAHRYTKRRDIAVFDNCYYGSLSTLVDISAKTYKRLPEGKKSFVHVIPLPKSEDIQRNKELMEEDKTKSFEEAKRVLDAAVADGRPIGCFISEMVVATAGVVVPPATYYQDLYSLIRYRGGICIDDETQTGLGRTGHFWAFQAFNVVPDILTVGKPLGNGFPMAILATTREIADCLGEFLNTFGGNPLACATGAAVLEVIANEKLISSARMVGKFLIEGLRTLIPKHNIIGEVRGMGLAIGIDIVCGRPSIKPATYLANRLLLKLRRERVIVALQGIERNVIVLTPPMCFTIENSRRLIATLDKVLEKIDEDDDATPSTSRSSVLGLPHIPTHVLGHGDLGDGGEPVAKRSRRYEEMD